ncbi:polysaccharide biosynthesis C-terminal domain-containing protein [Weizmannia sp. CD-2023]|nr:polysaccharide biosynthesis C-terminal domain-containing protein [Weizmannia sp. CD-2023]MEC2340581.1 polysaccharide biosynthesis C-terminal domain-containing protein [Weizmannia sp. CD-2023]
MLKNDFTVSLITKFITIVSGVITTALLNRYLGPSLRGEYAYFINIINLLVIVCNFGLSNTYGYARREKMKYQSVRYLNAFFLQFICYFIFCSLAFFLMHNKISYLILLLIPVETLANQMITVTLIDFIRFRQLVNIIVSFLNMLLTLICYIFLVRNIEYVYLILLIKDLLCIFAFLIKFHVVPNPLKMDRDFWRIALNYGTYAMFSALLLSINYKVDVILLGQLTDSKETGLYSVGISLAEYAWLIPDAFKDVIFARTARSDSVKLIMQSIRINMAFAVLYIAGIVFLGRLVINILYGHAYLDSYFITCILFFGIPSMILFKLTAPLYMANGKQKYYFYTLLISALSNVIANLLLIPLWGKEGSAIASVISYNICGLIFYIRFIKDYGIPWYSPLIIKKHDFVNIFRGVAKNGF